MKKYESIKNYKKKNYNLKTDNLFKVELVHVKKGFDFNTRCFVGGHCMSSQQT